MIGVVDYGAGNLQSVANALDRLGLSHRPCASVADIDRTERLLLPGVGHFGAAIRQLRATGLAEAIVERVGRGLPLLGICLGLQLLLDGSDEAPDEAGLSLVPGRAVPLRTRRSPHMGWNRVRVEPRCTWLDDRTYFYFAHGFVAEPSAAADVMARSDAEGHAFAVAVGRDNVWGVQFHPEKSGDAGLGLLERFARC